ncbi:MAG: YggS family pyridoxal phosphate-dependent enzyme [bacterium]|nr:YggS family pyridoxal phosphate-dependent enzyme [bacterium]
MNRTFLNQLTELIRGTPRKVTLVAVTKGIGVEEMNRAIEAGVNAIGENRVEEFEKKFPLLPPVEKHFIGQIQSRKIKRIVELFDCIQSVSSIEHLERIEKEAVAQNKAIKILLQFNISGEEQKGGFSQEELGEMLISNDSLSANSCELADKDKAISATHDVKIVGVMGIATETKDSEIVRKQFRLLKDIRDRLHAEFPEIIELSMGMSGDYGVALEEGSTILRIGRALFND